MRRTRTCTNSTFSNSKRFVLVTGQRQRDVLLCQVGPIEGPSPKPRSGHRIVYHKGKIYSFGGFNPAVDGADPDLEGDEYWQDSKPLFKVRLIMEV